MLISSPRHLNTAQIETEGSHKRRKVIVQQCEALHRRWKWKHKWKQIMESAGEDGEVEEEEDEEKEGVKVPLQRFGYV